MNHHLGDCPQKFGGSIFIRPPLDTETLTGGISRPPNPICVRLGPQDDPVSVGAANRLTPIFRLLQLLQDESQHSGFEIRFGAIRMESSAEEPPRIFSYNSSDLQLNLRVTRLRGGLSQPVIIRILD